MIERLTKDLKDKSIEEQLKSLAEIFKNKIAFSTSFGLEDQVITDMIYKNNIPISVFTLDTGRFFEETYKVWKDTNIKYSQKIKAYFPDNEHVEKMVSEKGIYSFYDSVQNRIECCRIRKVEPLTRALSNIDLWITGLRAQQSDSRSELTVFEANSSYNTIKFNPILNWTIDEVLNYIKINNVPYNELSDKGFISIGCSPCTRAIKPGEDFRAGRWWWESKDKKECGIHVSQENTPQISTKNIKFN